MTSITDTLCAIERRAERAIVQELRLMIQEILAMRTQLTLDERAHADALLLKLSHLESCQQVEVAAPHPIADSAPAAAPLLPPLRFDMIEALQPSGYLVYFYGHELGDLERVELTESLPAAAQLIRQQLVGQSSRVRRVTHDPRTGHLSFLAGDDTVLACVQPCEPSVPNVEVAVCEACAALARGEVEAFHRLFVATDPHQVGQELLAA
ncbi:hypothetical protein [Diaphorobacter aerolatus]|uniref:Uncharacterized protein n=1 Tax=Diaphorobacter aerolatus TaxID=1288495 RepID=A0A7H0GK19_9BURK|nr:hypothetical protein [Diaphorobacter aerolatus]QNP48635.1 hypothetical protein H9K75_22690 [Diaphorobacter aerolatus]